MKRTVVLCVLLLLSSMATADGPLKTAGVLYPSTLTQRATANAAAFPWAEAIRKSTVEQADPWMKMSDDALWALMFSPSITRSWMVLSDGFCPACKKDVRMYTWEQGVWEFPWKMRCPHCKELFPKNDFPAYYRSGLDEHGIFSPERADRSLLFNAEHPNVDDPLRGFGVDDGEGYVDAEGRRWRFIGAYLIYGQWKNFIVAGAVRLSEAFLATGDAAYARKAAILLDRVADVFPMFDFGKQGLVYEGRTSGATRGQVSTWHDACMEVRQLAQAYDRIFESARAQEEELTAFLSAKAAQYKLENPKRAWADIQRNIEDRIFRDTLAHRERIQSNQPTTDVTFLVIKTVLEWPANRDEVMGLLDGIIRDATKVDGLSGEKGMTGYAAIAPNALADVLAQFSRLEPAFLEAVQARHPELHATFRFHIDTWCMEQYYPNIGDCNSFARPCNYYVGISFKRPPSAEVSMFEFAWALYEATKDEAFAQIAYKANENSTDELPKNLYADDPAAFQDRLRKLIDRVGTTVPLDSVNKQQWHLAILRSGKGANQRALWLDYDSYERHSHTDGMNIGLFAKGLDLLPDFGYPPVGYGGWESERAQWYTMTAAHNTIVVDGKDQRKSGTGVTTLWADGCHFHAVRASDPAMIDGQRYERLVVLADLDKNDAYVIDCFLVEGGHDHAKFVRSHFGAVQPQGLSLAPCEDFGNKTQMRNFQRDPNPAPGWSTEWTVEDRYKLLPEPRDLRVRYTDLTPGASVSLAESWVALGQYGQSSETYVPTLMVLRTGAPDHDLRSTFASVLDVYEGTPNLTEVRRLPLRDTSGAALGDDAVGISIKRRDGRRDICLIAPPDHRGEILEPESGVRFNGALALVTMGPERTERVVLCQGRTLAAPGISIDRATSTDFLELKLSDDGTNAEALGGKLDEPESIHLEK